MIGVFDQQAQNLILLAEDEAGMPGQLAVEPEHLLLALARRGDVAELLRERGITDSDIHAATGTNRFEMRDMQRPSIEARGRIWVWVLRRR